MDTGLQLHVNDMYDGKEERLPIGKFYHVRATRKFLPAVKVGYEIKDSGKQLKCSVK